ncbi:Leucine Rich repeat [Novymonas esmeraldas]|uniref:Leucine Rich repeat n=1 Tax=Novymonas esmeraldas TaxID=1808958 RepID=A0AAW0F9K3_9TRYP
MEARLRDALLVALRNDVEKHRRLRQQCPATPGIVLKVNGTRLRSTVAAPVADRKRSRDAVEATASSTVDDWPSLVLVALASALGQLESDPCDNVEVSTSAAPVMSTASVLGEVSGVEVRHCQLRAAHVCSGGEADAHPVSLEDVLFAEQRPWRSAAAAALPATSSVGLTTLDLECNELGDAGVRVLCNGLLPRLRSLRRLLLASNGITAAGFLYLVNCAATPNTCAAHLPPQLETLGLTNNPLGTGDEEPGDDTPTAEVWCAAFRALVRSLAPTLRRLHLNHAGLNAQVVLHVVQTLFECVGHQRAPCTFDMVYLRANAVADTEAALRLLLSGVSREDAATLTHFCRTHVSL